MRLAVIVALCVVGCAPHSRDPASAGAGAGSSTATLRHGDTSDAIPYPATRADPVKDAIHGVVVPDPYRWLEDGDAPEVVAWSHAQDDLARAWIARLPELGAFESRFATLLRSGGEGRQEPTQGGSRYFFLERPTEADRWRLVYAEGLHGEPHVVLDSLAWRGDGSLSLGDWWVTRDGTWVAYQVKEANFDASILRVSNVDTREVLPESIDGADLASVRWLPDDSGFFYMQVPTAPELHGERFAHARIRFHRLRDPSTRDATVRDASPSADDPKPQTFQEEALSDDGRWLLVKVGRPGVGTGADFYFQDRRETHPRWRTLVEGFSPRSWAEAYRGRFYLLANDVGAQRAFVIDPDHVDRNDWKEIALAHDGISIDEWNLVGGRLAFTYVAQAVRRAEIHDLDGRLVRAIPAPSLGVTSLPHGRRDDDDAFFTFASFIQPQTIFHTSISRGTTEEWHRRSIPFDSNGYEIEQEFFKSKDGTRVPMFLVHKKGLVRDGTAPALLTGYGGFAISQLSDFSVGDVPWLEAGGVLVSVNLRGGLEYGEAWHRDGMGRVKQHVFDDFIAAAETLVRERVTSPAHLVSSGFSNAGLLVAAAMVQRPDLFAAVICDQPLTDMVRFAKYGKSGTGEFGDPADPDDFAALFAYSPLHHVVPGTRYPPVLVTMSEKDDRAHPMHARKFAAALQAATRGGPVLLRVQWNVGHIGLDSRPAYAEKIAQEYAFAMRFAR